MVVRKMGGNIESELRKAMASEDMGEKDAALAAALLEIARLKQEIKPSEPEEES